MPSCELGNPGKTGFSLVLSSFVKRKNLFAIVFPAVFGGQEVVGGGVGYIYRGEVASESGHEGGQVFGFAFPYGDDAPAPGEQFLTVGAVTRDVAVELGLPPFGTTFRGGCPFAPGVTMPEATMHEDNGAILRQDNVRFTRKIFAMKAEAISHPVK